MKCLWLATRRVLRWLLLVMVCIAVVSVAGCGLSNSGAGGGEMVIPPIDLDRPATMQTATFALG